MKVGTGYVTAWIAAYLLFAALPLLAALLVPPVPAGRGVWTEFAVGLGFVGLAMLGLQFVLTARFRSIAASFGQDTMLHFHRQAGLSAFVLLLAHPLILFAANPVYLAFLDPRVEFTRALALWAVIGALVLLVVLTLHRQRLGLSYELWRLTHALLAAFILFVGVVHVLRVGHYVSTPTKIALWSGMSGAALLLLLEQRVFRPARSRSRPFRVRGVRRETARAWTMTLAPEGHDGFRFRAGQFIWITLGDSPFSLQQHPFSISSSEQAAPVLEITIKELGDFTGGIGGTPVGTTAFLEGPYGAFTLEDDSPAAVFVVGGVGITPVMSILRTLRDRGDPRRLLLVYANVGEDSMLFREELDRLEHALRLRSIHVLENPPQGWSGETGRIDAPLLDRVLNAFDAAAAEYFICGPEPLMDFAERYLLDRGVALRQIRSERFNIV